eukprot:1315276-Amphidinium_carterae.1
MFAGCSLEVRWSALRSLEVRCSSLDGFAGSSLEVRCSALRTWKPVALAKTWKRFRISHTCMHF